MKRISARRPRRARSAFPSGFTLFEIIIVVAIIGIMAVATYPSIRNMVEIRSLDTAARDILSTLQVAKWQAVNAKLNHRVRFFQSGGVWFYRIEVEATAGTWTLKPRQEEKSISTGYTVAVTLPTGLSITFLPTGFVTGFDSTKNQVTLSSAKLALLGQPNRRVIRFFASGSVQYLKDSGT